MLGYAFYNIDNCEVIDSVKTVKVFDDEVQLFLESGVLFVDADTCALLKEDGSEVEIINLDFEATVFMIREMKHLSFEKGGWNDFVKKD